MRIAALVAWAALATLIGLGTGHAEKRVALVIGNSKYENPANVLANPQRDAQDVASVLGSLGFEVLLAVDADKRQFEFNLEKFARLATDADAALFYYAGHAMQYQGRNYLMPVDAELKDDISLAYHMVAFDDVRFAIDRAKGPKIVILDACRNNPVANGFARSISPTRDVASVRGLARIDKAAGMVVSYATAAGAVAEDGNNRNSPYTTALLARMQEAGLEIEMMFRRVAQDVTQRTNGQQRPETVISLLSEFYLNRLDVQAWQRVASSDDPEAFRAFMAAYPSSPLALQAKFRLDTLLGQRETEKRMAALAAQAPAPSPGPKPDEVAWEFLKDSHDAAALKRFVAQFPDSRRRHDAEQRIASLAEPTDPRAFARSVQAELQRVGCFGGAIDGEFSGATRTALHAFIKLAAIKLPDDEMTPETLNALRGFDKRVCPLVCPTGERAEGDQCIRIACPAGQVLKDGACAALPPPKTAARHPEEREPASKRNDRVPRPADRATQRAKVSDTRQEPSGPGVIACGQQGCVPVPKGCKPVYYTPAVSGQIQGRPYKCD
jgi:hypothetical protein